MFHPSLFSSSACPFIYKKTCIKSFRLRNVFPFSQMRSVIPLLWKIVRPADSYKQYDTPHRQCNPKTHPSQSTT